MDFMTWTDDYATGIDIVDQQHRHLLEMVNEAAALLLEGPSAQHADRQALFAGLISYTAEHFSTEEGVMRDQGIDPRVYQHHCQTHVRLVGEVLDWQKRLADPDPLIWQQLLGFLAGWLMFHVLGEDHTMARQIHAIQAGMTPERAYGEAEGDRLTPSEAALSRTVSGLYSQLSAQIGEIGLHNQQLEALVQARTNDLTVMAEDLRQARDAAEAASQAKSRFLGMVSHELRTPMNAIVGFTGALRNEGLPAKQDAVAARVLAASRQLTELIDGLIEYSRHEAAKPEPFELRAVLTEACREPFSAARAKGLKVAIEVSPELPACLLGDAGRVALVVRQFAANAAKFTAQGGLRVRAELIGTAGDGRVALRLSVIDTGPGIPADKQAGLFEVFHQLDDSPTRHFGGVGLGLALTRQAARMMGGEVGVLSIPGKGSQFWFDLSLQPAPDGAISRPEEPAGPPGEAGTPAVTAAPCDPEVLVRLERLLSEDDTRAGELLAEQEAGLRQALGERFDALAGQVAAFEYDHALRTLRQQD